MINYQITFMVVNPKIESFGEMHIIKGESLVELLSKFMVLMAQISEQNCEKRINEIRASHDDDIPF